MVRNDAHAGYRPGSLRKMFQDVSDEYDLLNRLLTFGLDRRWRARATTSCLEDSPGAILDLCCGTGDLLFTILRRAHGGSKVLGLDFTEAMIGRASMAAGRSKPLVLADAGHLPFRGESFDCVAIAFSFRNLLYKNPAIDRYLAEVLRVLRPGGHFVIVETSQPESDVLRKVYHTYLRTIVPFVGGAASGSKGAYTYLSKSATNFPAPEEVATVLRGAGFSEVGFEPLLLGMVGIHKATKQAGSEKES